MTANQQSGMQPTHTTDMSHFLIDFLTLSNEAGQGLIQLLGVHFYLQWSLGPRKKKAILESLRLADYQQFLFFLLYEPFVLYSEEGWCLAVYQPLSSSLVLVN